MMVQLKYKCEHIYAIEKKNSIYLIFCVYNGCMKKILVLLG